MSSAVTAVHSIAVIQSDAGELLTCRVCGATASTVTALSRIACLPVTVSTT